MSVKLHHGREEAVAKDISRSQKRRLIQTTLRFISRHQSTAISYRIRHGICNMAHGVITLLV